jgi:hypothetical protein
MLRGIGRIVNRGTNLVIWLHQPKEVWNFVIGSFLQLESGASATPHPSAQPLFPNCQITKFPNSRNPKEFHDQE